jgi:predicted transposase/invertase (TIGR01784 family)
VFYAAAIYGALTPFKKGIPWYTVTRICHEDASVNLADAAKDIIFNCTAYEKVVNFEQRALLKFIQTGKPESDLTWRLDAMVRKQKSIEENKHVYYIWSLHDQDVMLEGEREGRRIGRKEGMKLGEQKGIESNKLENARKLLTMKLLTHEQISEAVGLPLEKIEELALEINTAK